MPNKTAQRLAVAQPSKVETIGNANLLTTTVSDIRLQPSIDYDKHKASQRLLICNIKLAIVMCGTAKVNYMITGW